MSGTPQRRKADQSYADYSAFVGQLLRDGLLTSASAQLMLVEAFWDFEKRDAEENGIDLMEQSRTFNLARGLPVAAQI